MALKLGNFGGVVERLAPKKRLDPEPVTVSAETKAATLANLRRRVVEYGTPGQVATATGGRVGAATIDHFARTGEVDQPVAAALVEALYPNMRLGLDWRISVDSTSFGAATVKPVEAPARVEPAATAASTPDDDPVAAVMSAAHRIAEVGHALVALSSDLRSGAIQAVSRADIAALVRRRDALTRLEERRLGDVEMALAGIDAEVLGLPAPKTADDIRAIRAAKRNRPK